MVTTLFFRSAFNDTQPQEIYQRTGGYKNLWAIFTLLTTGGIKSLLRGVN